MRLLQVLLRLEMIREPSLREVAKAGGYRGLELRCRLPQMDQVEVVKR